MYFHPMYIRPILVLLCGLLFAACSSDNNHKNTEAVSIALQFPAGSAYMYTMDARQTIRQEVAGMKTEMDQQMKLESSYTVSAAGDDKRLSVNYDRFYIHSKSNGMSMEYDSGDSTKQPPELAGAGNIVNHPFSIIVNSKGEILKVEPVSDQTATAAGYDDSTIRQMMEQSLNIYPDKPVNIGDTWERTYRTNIGFMDMQVASKYKLVSVANEVAHLEVNAVISSEPGGAAAMQGMKMEMNGTQKGTMDIDLKTGLILDSKFTQDVKGKMSMSGTEIPLELTSETRILGRMK